MGTRSKKIAISGENINKLKSSQNSRIDYVKILAFKHLSVENN